MTAAFTLVPTATLFVMMLALGMELRLGDFARLLRSPRALLLGAVGQLVLLPFVAFLLIRLLALPPATAVGLMVLAGCPGGATSNVFSRYAGGDVALSISLTATSSLLAPLWVPLVVGVGLYAIEGSSSPIRMGAVQMIGGLLLTTAVPVMLGMLWLHLRPGVAERLRGVMLAVAAAVLVLLIVGLGINMARDLDDLAGTVSRSLHAVTLLVIVLAAVAAAGARMLRLSVPERRTLVLELGMQNVNLALVVVVTMLSSQAYLGPALVYLPVMLLLAFAVWAGSRTAQRFR